MKMSECNGWTNYETWNFKLWLDNSQINAINEYAVKLVEKKDGDVLRPLAEELKYQAQTNAPELEPSFYSDIMNASIREVNFVEIAESILQDLGYKV